MSKEDDHKLNAARTVNLATRAATLVDKGHLRMRCSSEASAAMARRANILCCAASSARTGARPVKFVPTFFGALTSERRLRSQLWFGTPSTKFDLCHAKVGLEANRRRGDPCLFALRLWPGSFSRESRWLRARRLMLVRRALISARTVGAVGLTPLTIRRLLVIRRHRPVIIRRLLVIHYRRPAITRRRPATRRLPEDRLAGRLLLALRLPKASRYRRRVRKSARRGFSSPKRFEAANRAAPNKVSPDERPLTKPSSCCPSSSRGLRARATNSGR
jgi:hypothetical protein